MDLDRWISIDNKQKAEREQRLARIKGNEFLATLKQKIRAKELAMSEKSIHHKSRKKKHAKVDARQKLKEQYDKL